MAPRDKKRTKLELVFNPAERQEFLTGFSKRKQARKKAARDQIEKQYKDEVARIKKDKREKLRKQLEEVSSIRRANGIDLARLVENELAKEKILDLPKHVVTITSTEEFDLTKCEDEAYLGSNSQPYEVEVLDAAVAEEKNSGDESEKPPGTVKDSTQSKVAQRNAASRVAALERKTQLLKAKSHRGRSNKTGKMSKSQKKFLSKKTKHKSKPPR